MLSLYDFPIGYVKDAERVYKAALKYFGQRDIFDVDVSCVSDREIRKINKDTRGIDAVTDVLSYPNLAVNTLPIKKIDFKSDVNLETGRIILGEIVICLNRAEKQAKEYGHSNQREYSYLFLHGLLHLFGFDHEEEKDIKKMREAEEAILNSVNIRRN
ncbi:MAG: rRNA maturation RNase YbeY [Clostridiales bacterium]|jgi:probable rRNA maturation factor|nr:rRNA maturation RNase YbeY [Clostridiales bacterium]